MHTTLRRASVAARRDVMLSVWEGPEEGPVPA
jgi:hypothetical protein